MRLHLGCGGFPIPSWVNLDFEAFPGVVRCDLSKGLPASIQPLSVQAIFSEHFLEHLTRDQAVTLLKSCYEALRPGGVIRVVVPDLRALAERYVNGKLYDDGPEGWAPKTLARMMNEGMRSWGHQFMYDGPELVEVLREAGFGEVLQVSKNFSIRPDMVGIGRRCSPEDLYAEAKK